jgi:hypothetical protein
MLQMRGGFILNAGEGTITEPKRIGYEDIDARLHCRTDSATKRPSSFGMPPRKIVLLDLPDVAGAEEFVQVARTFLGDNFLNLVSHDVFVAR